MSPTSIGHNTPRNEKNTKRWGPASHVAADVFRIFCDFFARHSSVRAVGQLRENYRIARGVGGFHLEFGPECFAVELPAAALALEYRLMQHRKKATGSLH